MLWDVRVVGDLANDVQGASEDRVLLADNGNGARKAEATNMSSIYIRQELG